MIVKSEEGNGEVGSGDRCEGFVKGPEREGGL